jgi:site-specific DNA-methyltransferase (adenine-specific)
MEVIYRKLSDMKKLDGNPRKITQEQLETLKQSIERNKDYFEARPLILSNRTGELVVIAGNQRYEACKQLGIEECPTVLLEGLTEEREKEIIIRDNVSNGEWDEELLQEWDSELLNDWGVDISDMKCFEEPVSEAEEDDFSEEEAAQAESRVQRGDIWRLGEHRLMCGDSTDAECVKALMGEQMADMVFTDPPYNVAIGSKNAFLNTIQDSNRITEDIANDKGMTDEEIGKTLWKPAFVNMLDNSKDSCAIYVTMPQGGTHMMMMMMMMMMAEAKWQVKHELIWVKNSPTFSMGRLNYDYQHEPIVYGWKKTHNWYGKGKFNKSIWNIDKPRKCDLHPTMKPVELVENALLNSSQKQDVILDLFGGSGTTLIACEQLERKCCTMEFDPHYCDVIIARWEKLTGKKAEKIN